MHGVPSMPEVCVLIDAFYENRHAIAGHRGQTQKKKKKKADSKAARRKQPPYREGFYK